MSVFSIEIKIKKDTEYTLKSVTDTEGQEFVTIIETGKSKGKRAQMPKGRKFTLTPNWE